MSEERQTLLRWTGGGFNPRPPRRHVPSPLRISHSNFDMCFASKHGENIRPVRRPISTPIMDTNVGAPEVAWGHGNAFAIRKQQQTAAAAAAAAAGTGGSNSASIPPLPLLPPLSSPKMERRATSLASSKRFRGSNKPLPMSPTSEYDPLTSAGLKHGVMYHYLPSPRDPLQRTSPNNSHVSELDPIRTPQQKYEGHSKLLEKQGNDLARLEKKIDDFSVWTQQQFRDLIGRFGNMSSANSDMFAKQTQLSYDIAKSRLELKTELQSDIYEMRTEINDLTAAFSDMSAKVEICLQRLWDNSDETFTEHQCRKNKLVQEDLDSVKNQLDYLKQLVMRVRIGLTIAQPNHALSYTPDATLRSTTPGRTTGPTHSLSMVEESNHPANRTLSKQVSTPQLSTTRGSGNKPKSGLLRSASGPASAFKAANETLENQYVTAENNRRWGIFNRRRRKGSDASSNSKFSWSGRRQKDDNDSNIPPVPSIPKGIERIYGNARVGTPINPAFGYSLENIHPALRPHSEENPDTGSPTTGLSHKTSPVEVQRPEDVSIPSTYFSSPTETRASPSPVHTREAEFTSTEYFYATHQEISVTTEVIPANNEDISTIQENVLATEEDVSSPKEDVSPKDDGPATMDDAPATQGDVSK